MSFFPETHSKYELSRWQDSRDQIGMLWFTVTSHKGSTVSAFATENYKKNI